MQSQNEETSAVDHLALFGTEGTANEGDGSLRNPVYWDNGHAILVWTAMLRDNSGYRDQEGNLVNPHILDPAFDTNFINCNALPVVPLDSEAQYFQKGALAEMDQLLVTVSPLQQLRLEPSEAPAQVRIDGFATKVNFLYSHPRTPVEKDHCAPGT